MHAFTRLFGPRATTSIALATSICAGGCERQSNPSGPPPADDAPAILILIGHQPRDPQWTGIVGGAERTASHYPNLTVRDLTPPLGSLAGQRPLINQAVAKGADLIAVHTGGSDPEPLPVAWLQGKGVRLITFGAVQPQTDGAAPHVAVGLVDGVERLAESLPTLMGDSRSFVLLHAGGRSEVDDRCLSRFNREITRQERLRQLTQRSVVNHNKPPGALVREMLEQFRAAPMVVALDPAPWVGPAPLRLPPEVRFVTISAAPALWPYVRQGQAAALVGPIDGEIGQQVVEIAAQMVLDSDDVPRYRLVPVELVTAENLDDFERRYRRAADLPATVAPADE